MVRILILIVLAWILYQIIKRMLANFNSKKTGKPEQKPAQTPVQTIVQCAHCGCHVPTSESQIKNNKIICNNPECQTISDDKDQHGD